MIQDKKDKKIILKNGEPFISLPLIENIIKESELIQKVPIEEEQSELYYETLLGTGKIIFKNGSVYQGNVKYGILESEGKTSTLIFPNGTKYEGEIHSNQLSGKGIYNFSSGSIYDGEVKNGL